MNSWNFMTDSIEKKDKNILNKYINKEKKDSVLILGSPINMNGNNPYYKPSRQIVDQVLGFDNNMIMKYPTNKFYASQGGSRKTGSALFNKNSNIIMEGGGAYRMRESTKRFLEGGAIKTYYDGDPVNDDASKSSPFGSMVGKALKYLFWDLPFKLQGKKTGGAKMDKEQLYGKLAQMFGIKGGVLTSQQQQTVNDVMKQMKANKESQKAKNQQKMDLKDEQMLEQQLNPLDKKEIARRKQLSGLTDKQKMTYMRMQNKKGKENYDAKVAEFDRLASVERRQNEEDDWRNTQKADRQEMLDEKARLKRIADEKANKSWGDKLLDAGLDLIPEAAGLIPLKVLQGPAKALLKEGVAGLKGRAKPSWYNKIADLAVEKGLPELTKLIPMKDLQDPTEKILRIGINQLRGKGDIRPATEWNLKVKAHMKKNNKSLHESSKALANTKTRKPSEWNIKVKAYMNKYNSTLKEALQALKK